MRVRLRFLLVLAAVTAGAAVGCAGAQVQLDGAPIAADAPEADQVRQAVQGYVEAHPGDLAGTFDVPGGEQESASFERYVAIHRTDEGFVARALFQDADHTYLVDFDVSNDAEPAVSEAVLARREGKNAD